MEQKVLIWTCVFVFVSTSIITLLGIINKINIDRSYLNKLFFALILEVVSIGVLAFKDSFKTPAKTDFVRITMPDPGFSYNANSGTPLFIKGAYLKLPEHILKGELRINTSVKQLTNISKSENIFLYSIEPNMLKSNENATIYLLIVNDKNAIAKDSMLIKVN
jgi:hypothetical protein